MQGVPSQASVDYQVLMALVYSSLNRTGSLPLFAYFPPTSSATWITTEQNTENKKADEEAIRSTLAGFL